MTQKPRQLGIDTLMGMFESSVQEVNAELAVDYEGVQAVRDRVQALRRDLAAILSGTFAFSIDFPEDLESLCKPVAAKFAEFASSVENLDGVPRELKDFALGLVGAHKRKIQKSLAEGYDFSTGGRDLYIEEKDRNKREASSTLIKLQLGNIVTFFLYKHAVEIGIASHISLDGGVVGTDLLDRQVFPKDVSRKIERYNEEVKHFVPWLLKLDRFVDGARDRGYRMSFEQLRDFVLAVLRRQRDTLGNDKLDSKTKGYLFTVTARLIEVFQNMSVDEFVDYKPDYSCSGNKWARDHFTRQFADFSSVYGGPFHEYRRSAQAVCSSGVEVHEEAKIVRNEDNEVPDSVPMPVLDDLDVTVDIRNGELNLEIDRRILQALEWIAGLPKTQRNSYVRHEIEAARKILADQACYDRKLVMFSLLKIEDFMQSVEVVTINGRDAVSAKPNQQKIFDAHVAIFRNLERTLSGGDSDLPSLIDEVRGDFQQPAEDEMAKAQREESQARFVTLLQRVVGKRRELAEVGAQIVSLRADLSMLRTKSTAAMDSDDYVMLQNLGAQMASKKQEADILQGKKVALEAEVAATQVEADRLDQLIEKERTERETREKLEAEKQRIFDESLADLVERSRTQDIISPREDVPAKPND